MSRERVDAVIVGAGASGGVVAHELAHAGLRIVLLERGPQLNVKDFQLHDEMISNSKGHLFPALNGLDHRHPREFRHTSADSFQKIFPEDGSYPLLAAVVGGGQGQKPKDRAHHKRDSL